MGPSVCNLSVCQRIVAQSINNMIIALPTVGTIQLYPNQIHGAFDFSRDVSGDFSIKNFGKFAYDQKPENADCVRARKQLIDKTWSKIQF